MTVPDSDRSQASWLSRGFEQLRFEHEQAQRQGQEEPPPFDVLIVGSGYGGAIAAETLSQYETTENGAKRKLRIAVLERGNEYLPGAFPANSTELPGHLRSTPKKEGLFDIRQGPDVGALVSNGVGGGSLINAGVMLRPKPNVFSRRWPEKLTAEGVLDVYFDRCELLLGSSRLGNDGVQPNTMADDGIGNPLSKYAALQGLNAAHTGLASITVAVEAGANSGNVELNKCIRCGDCAVGCNHGSKDSLDSNLLRRAFLRGVTIYSGATVLRVALNSDDGTCHVATVHTETKLRCRQGDPLQIRAHNVILAAGTFGSVEILHRSRLAGLPVSRMLGRRCSTNGDTMITHFDTGRTVNAVADEADAPASPQRRIGSTINGVLDLRGYNGDGADTLTDLVIEEMAVPGHLRRLFSEIYTTSNLIHNLSTPDCTRHADGVANDDLFEVRDNDAIQQTGLYAVMGNDGAEGYIEFVDDDGQAFEQPIPDSADGVARMRYSGIANHPLFDREVSAIQHFVQSGKLGGQVIPNPAWNPLPDALSTIAEPGRGPVVTVHPLGGCVMADHSSDGVVNQFGQVFEGEDTDKPINCLAVLDGSIIPSSLSANPALTISAVALRATIELAELWDYTPGVNAWSSVGEAELNPKTPAEEIEAEFPGENTRVARAGSRTITEGFDPEPTLVRVTERMSGNVRLKNRAGNIKDLVIELTLRTESKALRGIYQPSEFQDGHVFPIDTSQHDTVVRSRLRIFPKKAYDKVLENEYDAYRMEQLLDGAAEWSTEIADGSVLAVFERESSCSWWRVIRGFAAYTYNHGLRDLWQRFTDRDNRRATNISLRGFVDGIKGLIALASRAGERRTMLYRINLNEDVPDSIADVTGRVLLGRKCFTYSCRGNPWTQLSTMQIVEFPGRMPWREFFRLERRPKIALETKFLARIRVPLIEITAENDGVTALSDMASMLAYIARMTLGIHTWSFRAPDKETNFRPPQRLPQAINGLAPPEIHEVYLGAEIPYWDTVKFGDAAAPVSAVARLTRYRPANRVGLPLLMIHGYSASGTSFAHKSVDGCYAQHFFEKDRDVWIVDLRSSCGMPTARNSWSFEQMAYRDIPEVVKHICEETGNEKIDVIAHCMGAAMFGMGMLRGGAMQIQIDDPDSSRAQDSEANWPLGNARALRLLPSRIGKAVFSQVSSTVVLSPDNIFRGYVAQSLRQLLPDDYEFNPPPDAGAGSRLLDRALATLPYPDEEFRRENPWRPCARTPWTRTRHRMDALYGRVFNVKHMNDRVLGHINDFFGPLSIDTVSQTIEFARYRLITNVDGVNDTVARKYISKAWRETPLLMLNSRQNGLADYATCARTAAVFKDAGVRVTEEPVDPGGHQDCLIGTGSRARALEKIDIFFSTQPVAGTDLPAIVESQVAYPPWMGPIIQTEIANSQGVRLNTFRIGSRPDHVLPAGAILVRVTYDRDSGALLRPDGVTWTTGDKEYLIQNSVLLGSIRFRDTGWEKFFLPPASSVNDGQVAGNAWLALVVYDEGSSLAVDDGRYFHNSGLGFTDQMISFNPYHSFFASLHIPINSVHGVSPNALNMNPDTGTEVPNSEFDPIWAAALNYVVARSHAQPPGSSSSAVDDPALPDVVLLQGDLSLASLLAGDAALDRLVTDNVNARNGIIPDLVEQPDGSEEISFLLSSCQYPAAFFDSPVAYPGYANALHRIESSASGNAGAHIVPKFAVLAGDQVYADPTAGLYDPTMREGRFELPYQQWLRFPTVRGVLRQIPSYMLLDDHEIADNWEPILDAGGQVDAENGQLRNEGVRAYAKYQRGMITRLPFGFAENGHRFTLFDTRSERPLRNTLLETLTNAVNQRVTTFHSVKTVLGGNDLRPIYVITPSMVLPRHRSAIRWDCLESAAHSDSLDGYPRSLFELLAWLVDDQISNIVFLSGDEHLASYTKIELARTDGSNALTCYSIHSAPAFAPYPFANSRQDLLASSEIIHFSVGTGGAILKSTSSVASGGPPNNPLVYDYRCEVTTTYPAASNGMTYLRSYPNGNGHWAIDIEFPGVEGLVTIPDISA